MNAVEPGGRDRILAALGTDRLSGYELLVRLERPTAEPGAGEPVGIRVAASEAFLYPALHGLEAGGRVRAAWSPDAMGRRRRVYRRA